MFKVKTKAEEIARRPSYSSLFSAVPSSLKT
jgi:hypothetical protein